VRITTFFVLGLLFTRAHAVQISILEHGAVGDSSTLNTEAIQQAVNACHEQGGGIVVIPAGKFVSGGIVLKDHVVLHLEPGAFLIGSVELEDFPKTIPDIRSYTDNYTNRSLIYAEHATNIGITGKGTINGRGWHENYQGKPYLQRPYIIRMISCRNILIRDIALKDSPMWVQHYLACDDVVIDGITVESRTANKNNDGIDIDGCHNVRISNCYINCLDDAIVLKSTLPRKCRNVTVTNCILSSHCNAFKLGTETNGGFEGISFSNSVIHNTRLSGIALELVDGGEMRNVMISNISMDSLFNPFFIRLGNRARPHVEDGNVENIGRIQGITIDGIRATNIGKYRQPGSMAMDFDPDWEFIPASISGMPGHMPEDIVIRNIVLEFPGGYDKKIKPEDIALNETSYPEFRCMGILPGSVLYVRHVKDLVLDGWRIKLANTDVRPALFIDDGHGIFLGEITINDQPVKGNDVGFLNMQAIEVPEQ